MLWDTLSVHSTYVSRHFPLLALLALTSGLIHGAETVTVQVTDSTVTEGPVGDAGMVLIRRATATTSPLTVYLTTSGSATKGVDYGEAPASVVIPANATSVSVPIHAVDDVLAEVSETVVVTIATNAAYTVGSPSSGTVNLRDDEPMEISLSASDSSAAEPGTNTGVFTITRKGSASEAVYVPVTYDGTALPGFDYQVATSVAYIAPFSSSRTITITALNDMLAEPDETVRATIAPSSTYRIAGSNTATVTIADDEAPIMNVVASDGTASETGGNTGGYRIERLGSKSATIPVAYTMGGSASSGTDYTALSGSASVASGQSSVVVVMTPIDDTAVEGVETVIMTLATGTGYTLGASTSATVTLTENEQAVSITASDRAGFEPGTDTGQITITRASTSLGSALPVAYTISGSASSGLDFTALSGSVTIAANATSATVSISPVDDALVEGMETVALTLTPNAAFGIIGPNAATIEIGDNETAVSAVTVSVTSAMPEGQAGTASVNLSRTSPYTAALRLYRD